MIWCTLISKLFLYKQILTFNSLYRLKSLAPWDFNTNAQDKARHSDIFCFLFTHNTHAYNYTVCVLSSCRYPGPGAIGAVILSVAAVASVLFLRVAHGSTRFTVLSCCTISTVKYVAYSHRSCQAIWTNPWKWSEQKSSWRLLDSFLVRAHWNLYCLCSTHHFWTDAECYLNPDGPALVIPTESLQHDAKKK